MEEGKPEINIFKNNFLVVIYKTDRFFSKPNINFILCHPQNFCYSEKFLYLELISWKQL